VMQKNAWKNTPNKLWKRNNDFEYRIYLLYIYFIILFKINDSNLDKWLKNKLF
jgi:hypothetical protein